MAIQKATVATRTMAKRAGSRVNHAHIKFHRVAGGAHEFIDATAKSAIREHDNRICATPLRGVESQAHA